MSRRVAVVLMNLGGPDGPKSVQPFLFNLFRDPAIIGLPAIARYPLAALISTSRRKEATANYAIMGGGSPLLPETQAQADALEASLKARGVEAKCFIAMRYWHPLTENTARDVAAWAPDEVVLLPLYPQFSTTTTDSSLKAWKKAYRGPGVVRTVCCYPTMDGLVEAHARKILTAYEAAGRPGKVRLLFSAHGLPQKVIDAGDPYEQQIQATAKAVADRLGAGWDWQVCYQSRVGPLRWLGPSTPEAIEEAVGEGLGLVICPIAFVSEHVETLVELDHEYADLAKGLGASAYVRVAALGIEPAFINGLAGLTVDVLAEASDDWTCGTNQPKCAERSKGAAR
ncbi:ferrochelatase [Caulobacter segnis]|uniref:ferrochelatase n=1 Tax=Caulobacter segnis TaxID=88688 RepID=UPI00240EDA43|nr:ferrochelatase [Caulobacter segnis]MDG2521530.1 ferrochelatase [Caulobacter segnis]